MLQPWEKWTFLTRFLPVSQRDKCAKCSRYGHFAPFCRGNLRPSPVRDRESRPKKTSNNSRRSARQTNHVGGCSCAFHVAEEGEEVCMVSVTSEPTMDVSISGIVMEVLLGSVSNLMGQDDFQKLRGLGFKGGIAQRNCWLMGGRKNMTRTCTNY